MSALHVELFCRKSNCFEQIYVLLDFFMYLSYSMRSNNLNNIGVTAIGRKCFGSVGRATFGVGLILDILKNSGTVRESNIRSNNEQMGSAKVSAV